MADKWMHVTWAQRSKDPTTQTISGYVSSRTGWGIWKGSPSGVSVQLWRPGNRSAPDAVVAVDDCDLAEEFRNTEIGDPVGPLGNDFLNSALGATR